MIVLWKKDSFVDCFMIIYRWFERKKKKIIKKKKKKENNDDDKISRESKNSKDYNIALCTYRR